VIRDKAFNKFIFFWGVKITTLAHLSSEVLLLLSEQPTTSLNQIAALICKAVATLKQK
jgi:hypothetical protein